MNDRFPPGHVPTDHAQPLFTIPEDDDRFGNLDQIHQARIVLSCFYDQCQPCITATGTALADNVEDLMAFMRIVVFCITMGDKTFPERGTLEEQHWRRRLTEGWEEDPGTPLYQRCGMLNHFGMRFVDFSNAIHPCGPECHHARERQEMWDAIERRER